MTIHFRSIRVRLTLWFVVVNAAFLITFGVLVYVLFVRDVRQRFDTALASSARSFETALRVEVVPAPSIDQQVAEEANELPPSERSVALFRLDGTLIAPEQSILPLPPDRIAALMVKTRQWNRFLTIDEVRLFATSPFRLGAHTVVIVSARSQHEQNELITLVRNGLLIGTAIWTLLAGALAWRLVRKSLAPVLGMSHVAEAIGSANLAQRIPVHNEGDELGTLAMTFNALLDRLTTVVEQQRRFMADAAHQLRTPVAIVRGEAEVALSQPRTLEELRDSLGLIGEEAGSLSAVIDDLFLLTRADAAQVTLNRSTFYLDELVANAARSVRSLADNKHIAITTVLAPDSEIVGDESLLHRAILNLIDNAVKYSPAGGTISLTMSAENGHYLLRIVDSAPPIPFDKHMRVFERFYRSPGNDIDGAGLGLPIARTIISLHGGKLHLTSDKPGNTFHVELPAS